MFSTCGSNVGTASVTVPPKEQRVHKMLRLLPDTGPQSGYRVMANPNFWHNLAFREWGVFSAKGIVPFSATLVSLSSERHAINHCGNKNCTKDKKKPGRPANCCSANTYRIRIGDADYLKLPADGVLKLHHLTIFGQSVSTAEPLQFTLTTRPKGPGVLKAAYFTQLEGKLEPITSISNTPLVTTLSLNVRTKDIHYVAIKPSHRD